MHVGDLLSGREPRLSVYQKTLAGAKHAEMDSLAHQSVRDVFRLQTEPPRPALTYLPSPAGVSVCLTVPMSLPSALPNALVQHGPCVYMSTYIGTSCRPFV